MEAFFFLKEYYQDRLDKLSHNLVSKLTIKPKRVKKKHFFF